jgi:hypothetical protein
MNDDDRTGPGPHGAAARPGHGPDEYRRWDAAYVLGALSPVERREFEEHLATCPTCQSEVAEVAGMPGILSQMSPEDAAVLAAPEEALDAEPPDRLRDRGDEIRDRGDPAVDKLREPVDEITGQGKPDRQRRRLVRAVVVLAAALVLLAGVVGVSVLRGSLGVEQPTAAGPFRLAFSPVVPTDITAVVDVVPLPAGTELNVECQYADEGTGPSPTGRGYDIVVVDRSGHATPIKSWTARPAHKMTPSGTSSLPVSEIARVEIRPEGKPQPLLRAELR